MTDLLLSDAERDLVPGDIQSLTELRRSPRHRVVRVTSSTGSYVLKSFLSDQPVEVQMYALLESLDIPTLPVHARSERTLLLEDLQESEHYRLAVPDDMQRAETGRALAKWYSQLHHTGRVLLSDPRAVPHFLTPWVDSLDVASLENAGERLEINSLPGWKWVLAHLEELTAAYRSFPQTFNYNDFSWVNLALTRKDPVEAVVFDYDCFSLGTAYSDCRNVMSALSGQGLDVFRHHYGPIDLREKLLDDPLSTLFGIWTASQREKLPQWSLPLLEDVQSGRLEVQTRQALELTG